MTLETFMFDDDDEIFIVCKVCKKYIFTLMNNRHRNLCFAIVINDHQYH